MTLRLCVLIVGAWLLMVPPVLSQATNIHTSGTLPTNCTVGNIYLKTGSSAGFYTCLATDTWSGPLATAGAGSASVIGITIDGGGSAVTTGVKGYVRVPFACTITGAELLADQSGSIVVDVWKDSLANFPPTDADSITASAPPTISSDTDSEDTTLTGWTTSVGVGDVLGFNVDSASTVTRVTLELPCTRS